MDDVSKPVNISISGKLTYEDDITVNQAAQIIAFIDSSSSVGLPPAPTPRLAPVQIASPAVTTSTPREAIETSGAKTNPQKILAFAGYLMADGKDTFTLEDIRSLFRRAREVTPKNMSRDFDSVIRAGWVDESDFKGEYYITKSGLGALKAGFSAENGGSRPKGKLSTSRKARPKTDEIPEAFKDVDPIPSIVNGQPFSKLSSGKDRLVWALALAKTLSLEGLTNQEIAWVTDYLGNGIPIGNISGDFRSARNADLANKSTRTQKLRITEKGEQYLAVLNQKADS